jgi:hypothetical protein
MRLARQRVRCRGGVRWMRPADGGQAGGKRPPGARHAWQTNMGRIWLAGEGGIGPENWGLSKKLKDDQGLISLSVVVHSWGGKRVGLERGLGSIHSR